MGRQGAKKIPRDESRVPGASPPSQEPGRGSPPARVSWSRPAWSEEAPAPGALAGPAQVSRGLPAYPARSPRRALRKPEEKSRGLASPHLA